MRTFGENLNTKEKSDTEDDLESDRESPVDRGLDERESKVDPVRQHGSSGNHTFEKMSKSVSKGNKGKNELASIETCNPRLCDLEVSATCEA